ncbi:GNAT family N-acetyltransferase [Sulfurivermis fontis]|uniref:GNAT family N-acetyltransferase n=1 Tax=Sulfurivermis fontis TaxID=1972068 RepID=UPI000FDBE07D|nr:GNAT family N-acetyltransferase [Sulfurivermis fontis]
MSKPAYSIRDADWIADRLALSHVRRVVFMQEQGVPAALEWDEWDTQSRHFLAEDAQGHPIATARLLPDGHIGRMAVLQFWRRRGVGTALMRHVLAAARAAGFTSVELAAQTHALTFYRRFGFEPTGAEFMDAGIPHRNMRLLL